MGNAMNGTGRRAGICAPAQKSKAAHLYLRRRKGYLPKWVIRHGGRMIATGCGEDEGARASAMLTAFCEEIGETAGKTNAPRVMARFGWIYFVSCSRLDFPVKIGWATDVKLRLQALQCAMPYRVQLLAAMRGTLEDERQLHVAFKATRLEGEWFSRSDQLMALIASAKIAEAA
jgi:hypothetical protein